MSVPVAIISAKKAKFAFGEISKGVKFFSLSEPQLDILASPTKYTAAFAGTGGGKTCLGALWMWKKLEEFRKTRPKEFFRGLVVSPTYPIFQSSQLKQHICGIFQDTCFEGTWETQPKIYRGDNFEIVCKSADNDYKKLTGGQYNAILCDEAWSITNVEVWHEIRRRSNIQEAPILVVTTPNVDGWLRTELMEPFLQGNPEYFCRQWATEENPTKTKEEHKRFLDEELIKLGEARFARMYKGEFSAITGLIYSCFSSKGNPKYPVIPESKTLPSPAVRIFGGCDWGWSDPACFTLFAHCENDIVYLVDEIYGSKIPIDILGIKIKDLINKWSIRWGSKYGDLINQGFFDFVYCDVSRPETVEVIRRYGIPCKNKKVTNIDAGIALTESVYRCGRLKVFDNCKNIIREASSYHYDDKGQPRKNQSDHAMESKRLAVSSYFYDRPITVLSPETLTNESDAEAAVRLGHVANADEIAWQAHLEEQRLHAEWRAKLETWEPGED